MKLHRDGSHLANITTFEIEMRRRLWWQICFIDSRSEDEQVSEYKLSEGLFDTDVPTNTDDAGLTLDMSKSPLVSDRWTDMTVFLIRCEVWKLSRRLQSIAVVGDTLPTGIDERLELFQEARARIENTYLKNVDHNKPLQSFMATISRMFLTKVDLVLHTKQQSARAIEPHLANIAQSEKMFLFSLSIIEYTYSLLNEPRWNNWSWQIEGRQPPWNALHIVFGQLCTRPWGPVCERAWSSAKRSLDGLHETFQRDPRYLQLSALSSAVQRDRADEIYHEASPASTCSHFDTTSTTVLSIPLAQVGISGTDAACELQGPYLATTDGSNNNAFSDVLSPEMDWLAWDQISGELEPYFDFWDIGGL
jgi:hypothetical protein